MFHVYKIMPLNIEMARMKWNFKFVSGFAFMKWRKWEKKVDIKIRLIIPNDHQNGNKIQLIRKMTHES